MMANSFGQICNDWMRKNGEYRVIWVYDIDKLEFRIDLTRDDEKFIVSPESKKCDISAKAIIPDSPALSSYAVELSLNIMQAQLGLYETYGIKI